MKHSSPGQIHNWSALVIPALLALSAYGQNPQQNFDNVKIEILPVQGNVHLMTGAGGNVTVQSGNDGVLLVDTMFAPLAQKIAAALKTVNPRPIRFIINTHVHGDHTGGNGELQAMGDVGATPVSGGGATLIAHENVLNRMVEAASKGNLSPKQAGIPTEEYFMPQKDFFFNGEAVVIYHMPNAHTDGDSIVFFRKSDVISAGDIFTPERYPFLDLANGGSIQGEIAALNQILLLTVPEKLQDGGTRVIPGHGRICNEADVVEYRDMVTIVRDRVQDAIKRGRTLEQTKTEKLTSDYDNQYGNGDTFVEAVYKSLTAKK
jgi:glyoxylase-like metal-dependent hydrolase (beta-lactamase superfamily II)